MNIPSSFEDVPIVPAESAIDLTGDGFYHKPHVIDLTGDGFYHKPHVIDLTGDDDVVPVE